MDPPSPTGGAGVKRTRRGGARARRVAGLAGLAGLIAASLLVVAGAQSGLDVLVPSAKLRYPGWLHGPLEPLDVAVSNDGLAWLLLALCASYALVLAAGTELPRKPTLGAIAALHLLYVLAPPLLSSDVFGYVDLGRLGAVHGIDPYSPADTPLPADEVYAYRRWGTDLPAPYGPLFVAAMYPLGLLGVPGALWAIKALLGAASLGVVALVHRAAERAGRDPLAAAAFVGLNPILLMWGVGGAHNDFFFVLLLMVAVTTQSERVGGAALAAGAAVKASAGLPLVLMLAGARSRRAAVTGVLAAGAAVLVLSAAIFGTDVLRIASTLRDQQDDVAIFSFPNQLGDWLGFGGITDGIRLVSVALLVGGLAWMLAQVARRRLDWVAAAGWATALLLVTTAWLLPWYLVWLLPLA
ncbi:MAG TPA: glycosyltransferase 87 family protein, partial [Thermoleophilaceae bacterium]